MLQTQLACYELTHEIFMHAIQAAVKILALSQFKIETTAYSAISLNK